MQGMEFNVDKWAAEYFSLGSQHTQGKLETYTQLQPSKLQIEGEVTLTLLNTQLQQFLSDWVREIQRSCPMHMDVSNACSWSTAKAAAHVKAFTTRTLQNLQHWEGQVAKTTLTNVLAALRRRLLRSTKSAASALLVTQHSDMQDAAGLADKERTLLQVPHNPLGTSRLAC